jgi:colicin import membrane protein
MATAIVPGTPVPFAKPIDFAADLDAQVAVVLSEEPAATAARVKVVLWGQPNSPKPGSAYELILAALKRARGDAPAPKAPKATKATAKTTNKGASAARLAAMNKENALLKAWEAAGSTEGEWMASGQTYAGRPPTPTLDARNAADAAAKEAAAAAKQATASTFKALVAEKTAGKKAAAEAKADDKVTDMPKASTPGVSKRTAQRKAAAERKAAKDAAAAKAGEVAAADAKVGELVKYGELVKGAFGNGN